MRDPDEIGPERDEEKGRRKQREPGFGTTAHRGGEVRPGVGGEGDGEVGEGVEGLAQPAVAGVPENRRAEPQTKRRADEAPEPLAVAAHGRAPSYLTGTRSRAALWTSKVGSPS